MEETAREKRGREVRSEYTDGQKDRQTNRWIEGPTDTRTKRQTDGLRNILTSSAGRHRCASIPKGQRALPLTQAVATVSGALDHLGQVVSWLPSHDGSHVGHALRR